MKRIVLLVGFLTVIALCAPAQTYINFSDMHPVAAPTPMPDNYPVKANLYWDNFLYVTPGLWSGAGPGFYVDPATQHNTVAFIGGPYCNLARTCSGSIKLQTMQMTPMLKTFQPGRISLAAGWFPNTVIVTGYNNSKFVGSVEWKLTTKPTFYSFPTAWTVTQIVFTPMFKPTNTTYPPAGSMVIYSFLLKEQ